MGIKDKDGVDLHDRWEDGVSTYLGMTVHNFPNMYMVYGPQGTSTSDSHALQTAANTLPSSAHIIHQRPTLHRDPMRMDHRHDLQTALQRASNIRVLTSFR